MPYLPVASRAGQMAAFRRRFPMTFFLAGIVAAFAIMTFVPVD